MTHHTPSRFARALAKPPFWIAAVNIPLNFVRPGDVYLRYMFGTGTYPESFSVRTPIGTRRVRLHTYHDMLTLVECFGKLDYRIPRAVACVVDLGANIGLSGLYFLTRNPTVRAYLYEPVPGNVIRLRENLAGLEDRYSVRETAIAPRAGTARFAIESTGRYGGIMTDRYVREHGLENTRAVVVHAEGINDVLEGVLTRHGVIDLLKVDIEWLEADVVQAIAPQLLRRIDRIYAEATEGVKLPGFRERRYGDITRFYRNRASSHDRRERLARER